jgi:CMP-N-acetylneuraminic acid synthetase
MQKQNALCIIPARGGSKGIPGKNLRLVAGRPLIYWCIKAALDSGVFREVVVSTDSIEIGDYAQECGALVMIRPSMLATDTSPVKLTYQHILKVFEKANPGFEYVQLLQPVTPLIEAEHIHTGFDLLLGTKADIVVSVCQSTEGLGVSKTLPAMRSLQGFLPRSFRSKPRQLLPKRYHLNDCIFVGKTHVFRDGLDFYSSAVKSFAYIMPKEVSVDIDDEHDLFIADALLRRKHGEASTPSRQSFWRSIQNVWKRGRPI